MAKIGSGSAVCAKWGRHKRRSSRSGLKTNQYACESPEELAEKSTSKVHSVGLCNMSVSHINTGLHLGKTAIFNLDEVVLHGMNLQLIRPDERVCDPQFLNYQLNFIRFQAGFLKIAQHAVNQASINQTALKTVEVFLPPLNEQHRIVEKIDTLFARLDKGEAALREVQKGLQRYRQSVLKAAVTGELTRDWREQNAHRLEHGRDLLARILDTRRAHWKGRGQYKEPAAPDTTDLPELPEGWVWASVDQLADVIGGLTKNSKRNELPLRRPMLRVANVYQNRLALEDVHDIGLSEKELDRVSIQKNDLLVVEGNGSKDQIGRMAVWRGEIPNAVHQNHLIKVRMFETAIVGFALTWFQSPYGRQNVEKVASSTSGLYTLSLSKIRSLVVPLPSKLEVAKLVAEVQQVFEHCRELEQATQTELARSQSLRQSILKDAFAGRLVPQDPSDEPASELLARIRAEREAAPAKAKPKRRRSAAKRA